MDGYFAFLHASSVVDLATYQRITTAEPRALSASPHFPYRDERNLPPRYAV